MSQTAHAPVDLGLVIAGDRFDTGSIFEITNPARPGEVVCRLDRKSSRHNSSHW